jgi:hypothetical protein
MEKSISDRKTQSNYYDLFEIPYSASPKQIILAYENKITKFNNLSMLNQEQINEIKLLKVGLFILINYELRNNYNKIIGIKNQPKKFSETNEPVAGNQNMPDSLDSLFNVDNTWMKSNEVKTDNLSRKNKNGSNILGDRIFSLSELNKRPGFSSDFEIELRKQQQGRTDKSDDKLY